MARNQSGEPQYYGWSPASTTPPASPYGGDALTGTRNFSTGDTLGTPTSSPRTEAMGFNMFAAATERSRLRLSNPYTRSPIAGTEQGSPRSAQNGSSAGVEAEPPWYPQDGSPRTSISSPIASGDFGFNTNNSTASYSSSRTSSSMTLASPKLDHNQNGMSPVSNSRPSLASQIQRDKWKEKTWEMIARVQREEDERVKAYRERSGYNTSEKGLVGHRNSGHSDPGRSPPTPPGNLGPPNPGHAGGLRQRSATFSTALPETQGGLGNGLRLRTISGSMVGGGSFTGAQPSDGVPIAPEVPPKVPPKIPQKGVGPPSEHPQDIRGEGTNLFADVDKFIGGSNMYGRRERTRTELQPLVSPGSGGHVRELSAHSVGMTPPQSPNTDRQPKWERPNVAKPSATHSANYPHIAAPLAASPLELDSAPLVELSAQLSVRKKVQTIPKHQPPRRQGSPPPKQEVAQAQTGAELQTRQDNRNPPPAPPPKKDYLYQYATSRKPIASGGGGTAVAMSVAEQQAVMVGGVTQTQRERIDRNRERDKERVDTVVEGLVLRKLYGPRIGE